MFEIKLSETIAAPTQTVWEVITAVEDYPKWNPFIVACDTTFEVGAPIVMRVALTPSRTITQTETIFRNEPGHLIEYGVNASPTLLHSSRKHIVTPLPAQGPGEEAGTLYESHFVLKGLLSPMVRLALGKHLQRGFAGMAGGIARRAEALNGKRTE